MTRGPAPGLGAHTFGILEAAGFDPDEVATLAAAEVIAGPRTPEADARAARLASLLFRLAQRDGHPPAADGRSGQTSSVRHAEGSTPLPGPTK